MRMKYYAKLWLRYMRIGFLCMTQYPADTMIWFISMIIREACGFRRDSGSGWGDR